MTDEKFDWEMESTNEDERFDWKMDSANGEPDSSSSLDAAKSDFQASDSLVGQMLDRRFLIEKDLTEDGADQGAFGLLYLARDLKLLNRQVIVKILRQDSLKKEVKDDIVRKFRHEKEALIRLNHPNILNLFDSGTLSDGNPFLVIEYISGYSLRQILRKEGKLPFDFIAHIIDGVSAALGAAHSQNILHRDIKPENIMLTPQDENFDFVRLIDFGIARLENPFHADVTQIVRGIGTPLYVAPEQLVGELEQTPAVDIYSLAIVVYEMLTGELPFQPKSNFELLELRKQGVKVPPSRLRNDLPSEAERILLSALEFEAGKRPQNARAFGRALADALRDANKPVTTIEQKKGTYKTFVWAAAGFLILAAILIPLGLAIWLNAGKNFKTKTINSNTVKPATAGIQPINTPTPKELTYFLIVQKMRGKKPFEEPFKSSGQEIFENGYKFKMVLRTDEDGFIYLFNEGKDARGETVYNILYPTPENNNGSAQIKANRQVETGQNTFSGSRGTEIIWVVWSIQSNGDLDDVKQNAFDNKGIVSGDAARQKLFDFIRANGEKQPETVKDTANMQTTLKISADAAAYKMQLEHR
jgi:serine/threonine protein kinase